MNLKKMMSLLLALAMSFALAVPAFAAGPGDGDEGIMPLMQLYPNDEINIRSGSTVGPVTTTPGQGNYVRVWFRNNGTESVDVILVDWNTHAVLGTKSVGAGAQEPLEYTIANPSQPLSVAVRFNSATSMRVVGIVAIAQY